MGPELALFSVSGVTGMVGTMLLGGFLPNEWPFAGIVAILLCTISAGLVGLILTGPDAPMD